MSIKKSGNRPEITGSHHRKRAEGNRFLASVLCCIVLTACFLPGCGKGPESENAAKTFDETAAEAVSAAAKKDTDAGKLSSADKTASEGSTASSAASASSASPAASSVSPAASSVSPASPDSGDTSAEAITADDKKPKEPRMLKYIDAWDEWHTMEVDPAVKETAYDAAGFIHTEETPQWVVYSGNIADQAGYECLQGVDVSEHQGTIDWQSVADAGYKFAFIRVGYRGYGEAGKIFEDYMAVENLQKAKSAGLQVGTYFFSQALSEEEAAEEAALAVSVIEKSGVETDLPLMYDPEIIKDDWGRANEITREQVALNTAAFRETVENSSSCKVDIYSNLPWEHNYFDTDTMNTYDIWYADYEPLPQTPYHFTWWQYTNKGSVPGIEGSVDLNLWIRLK